MRWPARRFPGRDLDRELQSHLQSEAAEREEEGLSPEEARYAARRALGNATLVKESMREIWGWHSAERLCQDLRYSARTLGRSPGFVAIAVLSLALGIGANTAIFSMVEAVLLHPLPYRNADRLVAVWDRASAEKGASKLFDGYQDLEIYRQKSRSFEQIAGATWATGGRIMTGRGPSQDVLAIPASVDFFKLLGVSPAIGRAFRPDDLMRGCSVVLADHFWRSALGGQAKIVGQSLRLDDKSCDVVGVMPPGFAFYPTATAMWSLITPESRFARDPAHSNIGIFARLKPGVSLTAAQAELRLLHRQAHRNDRHGAETEPVVYPLQEEFTWLTGRNLRLSLIVLFAAVAFVLLITCTNVANLLLGRSLVRQREMAIRSALGSGRTRLFGQLLTEALLLSGAAAVLGTLLAIGAIHWFQTARPIDLPPGTNVQVNLYVLLFTAALSVLTAILFGFVPAWKTSKVDLNEALKANGRSATQGSAQKLLAKTLVAVEVMLSLVLLAGASLLIQSFSRFASVHFGFAADRIVTMTISLPPTTYASDGKRLQFLDELTDRLAKIPAIGEWCFTSTPPLRGVSGFDALEIEGRPEPVAASGPHDTGQVVVSPSYFGIAGVSLLRGRPFARTDRLQQPAVAIVNEALARKYFPNQIPIGQHIRSYGAPAAQNPWLTIVGVAANEKRTTVYQEMNYVQIPTIYRPISQKPDSKPYLLVTGGDGIAAAVERQVSALDPAVPIDAVQTLQHLIDSEQFAYPRFRAVLVSSFAGLAFLLATIGLYGVLSQLVTQRTAEIGVRMALGAQRRDVLLLIVRQGMLLVVAGTLGGLAAALLLTRFLAALLYGVSAADPATLAVVSSVLIATALLASFIPARRASRVDPIEALRYE
jgi:putative ABC transport system permease protein